MKYKKNFYRSEYGAFWKCIQAGLIYTFTQLAKMLVLATFFPDNDADIGGDFLGVGKNNFFLWHSPNSE